MARFWTARTAIADWQEDDNTQRPHSALANVPPAEFAIKIRLENRPHEATTKPPGSPLRWREVGAQVTICFV